MKRTGLVPTPMSYTVFFSSFRPKGAVSREAEEKLSTVWKQWQAYCEKAADPNDPMHQLARNLEYKVSSTPTNAYIAHIQKSGSQDMSTLSQLVDSLSSTSGVAPTAHTFSVIFRSIITSLPLQSYRDQKEHVTRCYDLCRQTWALMHDKWREGGLQLDALALSAASNAHVQLFRAAPSLFLQADKQRLLQQMEAMIGLERAEDAPETTPARQSRRSNKLDSTVMYDAMVLASAFEGRYSRHVLDWFTALRRHEASLLDARVCEMYMKAAPKSALGEFDAERACAQGKPLITLVLSETLVYMLRSPSTAMRPTLSTYTTAISLSPFIDQVRIIAHMSGRSDLLEASETSLLRTNLEAFQSEKELSKRALEKGYHTKYIQPDKKIMTILLQSALDLQDWRRIDRAVKITTVFLANVVPTDEAHAAEHSKADVYAFRLGENLKEACDRLISNSAVPESRRTELRRSQSRQQTDLKPRLSSLGRGKLART